ncbi:unnamed protein product [Absidia cylindrospora]
MLIHKYWLNSCLLCYKRMLLVMSFLLECINELSVFLEEKTEDIVKRVFSALDSKSYLPKDSEQTAKANPSAPTTPATTTEPTTSESIPATEKRSYHEEDDEDDEDDDTNFKRRNNKPASATVDSSGNNQHSLKRSLSTDDGSDNGPLKKLSRQDSANGQDFTPNVPLRQRLGDRKVRKRCFDYDRKGYCMRGDFCPYEHGEDHLVMETNGNGTAEPLNTNVGTGDGALGHGGGPMRIKGRGGMNRSNAGGPGGRGIKRQQEDVPYTSRYTPYSTKIVVENVPQEQCNIDSVTEFFGKFGKLVNLSIQADASRAFLQYASHQEAMAAYQSPAVIFNNRFVKVFWRKVNEEEERKEYLEQQRLASQPDPEAIKAKAEQLAKDREERQKKHQEHLQKVLQFQKQKQQLIERQIEEHKSLVEKLQHTPPKSKERESIMQAIANLSDSIKSNQVSTTAPTLTSSSSTSSPPPPAVSTNVPTTPPSKTSSSSPPSAPTTTATTNPLDAKKAEMERLKAKLASLEAEKSSGYSSYRGGRGGMNTWSARGARSFSLDNRNKATSGSLTTQIPTTTESQQNDNAEESNENAANKETTS